MFSVKKNTIYISLNLFTLILYSIFVFSLSTICMKDMLELLFATVKWTKNNNTFALPFRFCWNWNCLSTLETLIIRSRSLWKENVIYFTAYTYIESPVRRLYLIFYFIFKINIPINLMKKILSQNSHMHTSNACTPTNHLS